MKQRETGETQFHSKVLYLYQFGPLDLSKGLDSQSLETILLNHTMGLSSENPRITLKVLSLEDNPMESYL